MNGTSNVGSDQSDVTIKLRMDVDYAYPFRLKSFFYTALGKRGGKNYLKNSKIIAQMVNESEKDVKAYWFFTPTTLPDEEMLALMHNGRHEAAVHIATNPYSELEQLEKITNQKANYYTVHGTERLLGRLIWRRKLSQSRVPVPADFPLKNFWDFPTQSLDVISYSKPMEVALKITEECIARGEVLHIHPEWLFQRGTINHRGPYYGVLKTILGVDEEINTLAIRKKGFFRIARDVMEYRRDFVPTDVFLKKLAERGIDVFTFIERKWSSSVTHVDSSWVKTEDNIAVIRVTIYPDWLTAVGKKTRNMIRKAEKSGVKTEVVEPSQTLAEGIFNIYNETPIRQERAFPHYGISLADVKEIVFSAENDTFIGASLNGEVVGFIQLVYGDRIAIIQQILSLQKHSDKAINNTLIAKAVEVCASRKIEWLMYARMGNHPSLDMFKENNGFTKFVFPRYYVPLSAKGSLAINLGLHRDFKDSLPNTVKAPLFPVFNWVSRSKTRLRLWRTGK